MSNTLSLLIIAGGSLLLGILFGVTTKLITAKIPKYKTLIIVVDLFICGAIAFVLGYYLGPLLK